MIKIFIVAPSVVALYQGDQNKLYTDLEYIDPIFEYEKTPLTTPFSIDELVSKTKNTWKDFEITRILIQNYGDKNMHVLVEGEMPYDKKFTGIGKIIYKVSDGKIVAKKDPITENSYLDGVKNVLFRIHYGDYGGYLLKIISFLLGLITCFVIISGVMIWLTARDKKNMPEKKRKFNEGVVSIYLAICLSMYPVTALAFIASKVFYPLSMTEIYTVYFVSWLVLTIFFILKKNNYFTNKYTLLSGSILGFLVPISNGIMSGKWFWESFLENQFQVFFIDVLWILLSSATLYTTFSLNKKTK